VVHLAEHSCSHFFYSPFITRESAGRAQLVTLLLLSTPHRWVSWQIILVTFLLLSTHHPWVSWQSIAGHISVTLHSSPVGQLPEHSWSHFCYSPLITRVSAGRAQLVTLLLPSTHHPWISLQRNPHLVETKTINSYQLKSIFYIFNQILWIEKVTEKYGRSHNIQEFPFLI
jgi:hypothetical protein